MYVIVLFVVIACMLVPTATIYTWLRLQEKADRRSPLSDALLRQPGETLTRKLRDTSFDLCALVFMSTVVPSIACICLLSAWVDPAKVRADLLFWTISMFILGGVVWSVRHALKIMDELRAIKAGLEGELATAQLLSPLLAEGWKLFHDIPGKRGNIDHVMVGPNGIFAIESKYRSKRRSQKGKESALVEYDGKRLRFASGAYETLALEQAQATGGELAQALRGRLGHDVQVTPVVSLPGWFVRYTSRPDQKSVGVVNPKSHGWFRQRPLSVTPELQVRVCAALSEMSVRG